MLSLLTIHLVLYPTGPTDNAARSVPACHCDALAAVLHSAAGDEMGLDGGTVISRSDVLRGSSWRLNQSNSGSRSTRGGAVSTSQVYHEPQLDRQTAW